MLLRSNELLRAQGGLDPSQSCSPEREPFLRCLLAGLFLHLARRTDTASVSATVSATSALRSDSSGKFSFTSLLKGTSSKYNGAAGATGGATTAPYCTMRGRQMVHVHPSSVLFSSRFSYHEEKEGEDETGRGGSMKRRRQPKERLPRVVVFAEMIATSKQYMRNVAVLEESWLHEELAPSQIQLLK